MPRFPLVIAVILGTFSYANANTVSQAEQDVKREFRFYRIQVFNTFHRVRPEFDRRRAAGEHAHNAWKQAGGQPHQAEVLMQWYRDAKAASRPSASGALPAIPEFPAAVAADPKPETTRVQNGYVSQPPKDTGIYRVREVASRSIHHPENIPGDVSSREESLQPNKSSTVWASVSRALLRSLPLGGSHGSDEK